MQDAIKCNTYSQSNLSMQENMRLAAEEFQALGNSFGQYTNTSSPAQNDLSTYLPVGRDPVGVGHLEARGRAVPFDDDIIVPVNALPVRDRAERGFEIVQLGDLELALDFCAAKKTKQSCTHEPAQMLWIF